MSTNRRTIELPEVVADCLGKRDVPEVAMAILRAYELGREDQATDRYLVVTGFKCSHEQGTVGISGRRWSCTVCGELEDDYR